MTSGYVSAQARRLGPSQGAGQQRSQDRACSVPRDLGPGCVNVSDPAASISEENGHVQDTVSDPWLEGRLCSGVRH